ncbi:hypothetical protein [Dokdonella sp.]|uniref:hypothetical protein n=1 Tax=Dokdonella sp. TaxID=2291710 RepID=UPI002F414EAE
MGIWMTTAQGLPGEGEAVQFTIGARRVPLRGRYRDGEFATRWWRYPASAVHRWQVLDRSVDFAAHAVAATTFDERMAAAM